MLLLLASTALAATHAFVGATLHPVDQPVIPDGVLVVTDGRIVAMGPRTATSVPDDAAVHALPGRHLIPGLIDLHSHIGGGRLHEALDQQNNILEGSRRRWIDKNTVLEGSRRRWIEKNNDSEDVWRALAPLRR